MNKKKSKNSSFVKSSKLKKWMDREFYYMNNKSYNTPPNGFPGPLYTPQNAIKYVS